MSLENKGLKESFAEYALRLVLLALAYALTGYLTSFLVIPPGYASPIWPAAAIGLVGVLLWGYRYLPSVFVGSMVVNLYISYRNGVDWYLGLPLLIGGLVALGAVLQATLSVALIRRVVSSNRFFVDSKDVIWLVVLGGPIGCLVNSISGTGVLFALGALTSDALLPNWFTWWIGDSLGVFCFAPLLVYLFRVSEQSRGRGKFVVALGHLGIFALVLMAVGRIKEVELNRLEVEFQNKANSVKGRLESIFDHNLDALQAMDSFFMASVSVSSSEFELFTRVYVDTYPGIFGLSWNEAVSGAGRAEFEQRLRDSVGPSFEIRDRLPDGTLVRAGERELYYPVTYVAPKEANSAALGFDVFGSATRKVAMQDAMRRDSAVATGRISVVQAPDSVGVLVYHPVFRDGADKGQPPSGFVVGIFLAEVLAAPLAEVVDTAMYDIVLRDVSVGEQVGMIYDGRGVKDRGHSVPFAKSARFPVSFAGANWELEVTETERAVSLNNGSSIWVSTIAGFLFSGLAGLVMFSVAGRNEVVSRLVLEQTAELNSQARGLEKSNRELLVLAEQAEQASLAKSQFLAAMSHEIRTPMNGIIGVLHLLGDDMAEGSRSMLSVARQSADKLLVLINDILDVSKIEEGKMELELTSINTLSLVEEACALYDPRARSKGLNFSGRVSPENCVNFRGDELRLNQVLSNLLNNALKFTESGSVSLTCELEGDVGERSLVFRVKDTGIGVSDSFRGRLFEPFSQADAGTTRQYGGTGLGLSICRRLVELMGGTIRLEPASGFGAEFVVSLPFVESEEEARRPSQDLQGKSVVLVQPEGGVCDQLVPWLERWGAAVTVAGKVEEVSRRLQDQAVDYFLIDEKEWDLREGLKSAGQFICLGYGESASGNASGGVKRKNVLAKPIRIGELALALGSRRKVQQASAEPVVSLENARVLLVDDNATNTLVASAILRRWHKIEAETARNGEEALGLLQKNEYDVIFMDCMMPVMDGYVATRELRSGKVGALNQRKPVVALTANAMQGDDLICMSAGMSDYIAKPLEPKRLEDSLRRWMGQLHPDPMS